MKEKKMTQMYIMFTYNANTKMRPKKRLGQHFLICNWVVSTLIKAADIGPDDTILEIGPGMGILTFALAEGAKHVIAVEKDEFLAETLKKKMEELGIHNVELINADILLLKSDFNRFGRWNKVAANIPYYLTSRLIRIFLEAEHKPDTIALTVQKEVAERIAAKPPHMNLLAISVQAYGKPKIIKKIPAECFTPKPKVDSSIIVISDISDNFFAVHAISERKFFEIVRYGFSQKRKILLTSLKKRIPEHAHTLPLIFEKLGIKNTARPEELSVIQWGNLVCAIEAKFL